MTEGMKTPVILLATVFLAQPAAADEVFLKGGGRLSGRIVTRTEAKIEVDVGAGLISVPASSVLKVEEGRSALHEYEELARSLAPGDASGWLGLAQWAEARGLGTQARAAYERALAASPQDPRANEALGNVLLDGRWVSEDEGYRARGYVRFEGEWITPAEHEAILRAHAAEAEVERQRQEADERVRAAEARAEAAEARAQGAEAPPVNEGIPMWYSWGGVPSAWSVRSVVAPPDYPGAVPR